MRLKDYLLCGSVEDEAVITNKNYDANDDIRIHVDWDRFKAEFNAEECEYVGLNWKNRKLYRYRDFYISISLITGSLFEPLDLHYYVEVGQSNSIIKEPTLTVNVSSLKEIGYNYVGYAEMTFDKFHRLFPKFHIHMGYLDKITISLDETIPNSEVKVDPEEARIRIAGYRIHLRRWDFDNKCWISLN